MNGRWRGEDGAIPFVVVGIAAVGGVLGLAWAGQEWADSLLREAGGELTVWVLRGAFWALDLIALQAATEPVNTDWYTPVLAGPALPVYALAALVMVATLIAETIAGMATGNTVRIVQAVFRALVAGMLASAGGALLLAVGGGLSTLGRVALSASGTTVDAPLLPLQEALMDAATGRESGAELFVVFLAGLVIVFTALAIYFTLAMRPVLLAGLIVFLPMAHALSVWTPLLRVQVRAWALAVAVLVADAAILTMFAITNTVTGQPQGVDRLIFGTFGLLLAALAPAALARIVGTPELQTAVQSMSRGSRAVAAGAGILAAKGALAGSGLARISSSGAIAAGSGPSALDGGGAPPGGPTGDPTGGPSPSTGGGGTSQVSDGPPPGSSGTARTAADAGSSAASQPSSARQDAGPAASVEGPEATAGASDTGGWRAAVARTTEPGRG